jgi:D-alanyl-D-alanine carboxypeptidase (penicillin-binding protein 5/6)
MRLLRLILAAFAGLSIVASARGAEPSVDTTAEFAVIIDYDTGAVLFEKRADTPTTPSSMSKLMTVAVVFEKLKAGELRLADMMTVSEKAWREREGSSMWVRVDTEISVENLLRGIIVQSGNDACIVVAENISGSEEAFADLMTKKAREWGLQNSTFANAHGKPDPNHKMSMRDLAILTRKLIHDYPEYYHLFAERSFTWEKIEQPNRNPLFDLVEGADGLKTGHTSEAGYGLVGSAIQDGRRRIVVVNGLSSEKDRAREARRLFKIAFEDFVDETLYQPGDLVGQALVFKGQAASVPLVTNEVVSLIMHRSERDSVRAKVVYEGPVVAPIEEGRQIGFLRIEPVNGDPREFPLYAGARVKQIGVLGKIGLAAAKLLAVPAQATEHAAQSSTE